MSNKSADTSVNLFLIICSKIEGICAELYHYYSELFHADSDSFHLWKKTAMEEENHQRSFELVLKLANECELDLITNYEKAVRIHKKLTELLVHVKQTPPDIYVAITKAIEMEYALADLHLDSAVHCKDEQIKNMLKTLQGDDAEHINALKRFQSILFLAKTEMAG